MTSRRLEQQKILEEQNPCLKEQKLSLECLDANSYDGEKCQLVFQNYKNCNAFWLKVQRDRRREGIRPLLPPAAEREAIKAEYRKRYPKEM
ncbi:coiled-coil-helix-coiled-coil-helix domain-containing protein 7 [Culicoides brevitarsis]|uniref:coiled-coil-helix-coiled-coil-helix domain-containing protein 7 n=1 Tax=Culicoides brevitarsis TaxID=469753 RepID=UPI00307C7DD9